MDLNEKKAAAGFVDLEPEFDPDNLTEDPHSMFGITDEGGFTRFYSLDILRLFLMLLAGFGTFSSFGGLADVVMKFVSGFAAVTFFVISGFIVLNDDGKTSGRILRTIGRSAITFLIMLVLYFAINAVLYWFGGGDIFQMFNYSSKRFWFECIVLNHWPYTIGNLIWYVLALLEGYVVMFVFEKLKLLRFDWLLFLLFFAFTLITQDFSGLVKWFPLGYGYWPAGFITHAIPYMLLGRFIRRHLPTLTHIPPAGYFVGILLGGAACVLEFYLLGSLAPFILASNHLIGMAIMAFCLVTMIGAISYQPKGRALYFANHARFYLRVIYVLLQAVGLGLGFAFVFLSDAVFAHLQPWIWLIAFIVCLLLAMLIGRILDPRKPKLTEEDDPDYLPPDSWDETW